MEKNQIHKEIKLHPFLVMLLLATLLIILSCGPGTKKHQLNILKVNGEKITLICSSASTDPSWSQLNAFLMKDNTDKLPYIPGVFTASEYAEKLQNRAEEEGIRCFLVIINSRYMINAFDTTDRGLIYIDCCSSQTQEGYDNLRKEYLKLVQEQGNKFAIESLANYNREKKKSIETRQNDDSPDKQIEEIIRRETEKYMKEEMALFDREALMPNDAIAKVVQGQPYSKDLLQPRIITYPLAESIQVETVELCNCNGCMNVAK